MDNDKRSEIRLQEEIAVFIEVGSCPTPNKPSTICITNTLDISANGIQLVSEYHLPMHSLHQLCIEVEEQQFNLVGEVMWLKKAESFYTIGLRLIDSEHTEISHWKEYICEKLSR